MAHEYGHAVDAAEANLEYQGESGALDESFADIYGCLVEEYALGSNDWLMGEERCTGAIRNIGNPNDEGDPDTYGGTYWASTAQGAADEGGVHTNSGVQNFWFYLLSNGGSGTNDHGWGYGITGIGTSAAGQIAYRNHTTYLTSNSNYASARQGAIQAAADLFGNCSVQQQQTANAWRAVGVGPTIWYEDLTINDSPPFFYVAGTWYATGTITSGGSTTLINGSDGNTLFKAGNKVSLIPGFRAVATTSGISFRAVANTCSDF